MTVSWRTGHCTAADGIIATLAASVAVSLLGKRYSSSVLRQAPPFSISGIEAHLSAGDVS
jgi:uncharacterized membrane protein YjjB (DUF3815 family)